MDSAGLWTIIGDHINPGFKSTKALVDARDLEGLQALAVRQVESGADALDFTLGPDARNNEAFLVDAIRAVQEAVSVPLCFDYPESETQQICLRTYDPTKANGAKPMINSIAETRWEMVDLLQIQPARMMVMASERLENGTPKPNRTADEIAGTAKRCAQRLLCEHGLSLDEITIDVSIQALISDTSGHNREALEGIRLLGSDPELPGLHIGGGLVNISQMLPAKAADGSNLKRQVECAFLTLAQPLGMDTIVGTPWRNFQVLPEDNYVLGVVREIFNASGADVIRAIRKLYAA
jgi:5-methyltetrahydrofolate--homocysteine methyltransferase